MWLRRSGAWPHRWQIAERETKDGGTELWLDVEVRLPLPDRGYWLTAQEHERIMDVRRAPTPQRIGKAASRGDRRPLSSLSQWDDPAAGRQYRLATFGSTSNYECLWRNLRDAYAKLKALEQKEKERQRALFGGKLQPRD